MTINNRTSNRNYAKPNVANLLSEDVVRLSEALDSIDTDVAAAQADLATKAPLASPALTGTPSAPTPAVDTNTTQLATTAFVLGQASAANPVVDGTAAAGSSSRYARADHVHPTDTTRAPAASPTFTGTPIAPTAAADTNTAQLATTAFVIGQNYTKQTRTVFAGAGLTGGGDLSANRTIAADFATQLEAEAGTSNAKLMTPQRTAQAFEILQSLGTVVAETFTSSGTFTKDADDLAYIIYCVGGGGGGGKSGNNEPGSGGGGAGNLLLLPALLFGSTVAVTVGSGGAGATNPVAAAGSNGGASSFGTQVVAYGGGGGGQIASGLGGTVRPNFLGGDSSISIYGGGLGTGTSLSNNGGSAHFGGGGGGRGSGGTSVFAGAGGAATINGGIPGGGGGGSGTENAGAAAGSGGRGQVTVYRIKRK